MDAMAPVPTLRSAWTTGEQQESQSQTLPRRPIAAIAMRGSGSHGRRQRTPPRKNALKTQIAFYRRLRATASTDVLLWFLVKVHKSCQTIESCRTDLRVKNTSYAGVAQGRGRRALRRHRLNVLAVRASTVRGASPMRLAPIAGNPRFRQRRGCLSG